MLKAHGLSTTQSPSSVQTIAWTAVHRIASAPFKSSAAAAADSDAASRTSGPIATRFRIPTSSEWSSPAAAASASEAATAAARKVAAATARIVAVVVGPLRAALPGTGVAVEVPRHVGSSDAGSAGSGASLRLVHRIPASVVVLAPAPAGISLVDVPVLAGIHVVVGVLADAHGSLVGADLRHRSALRRRRAADGSLLVGDAIGYGPVVGALDRARSPGTFRAPSAGAGRRHAGVGVIAARHSAAAPRRLHGCGATIPSRRRVVPAGSARHAVRTVDRRGVSVASGGGVVPGAVAV